MFTKRGKVVFIRMTHKAYDMLTKHDTFTPCLCLGPGKYREAGWYNPILVEPPTAGYTLSSRFNNIIKEIDDLRVGDRVRNTGEQKALTYGTIVAFEDISRYIWILWDNAGLMWASEAHYKRSNKFREGDRVTLKSGVQALQGTVQKVNLLKPEVVQVIWDHYPSGSVGYKEEDLELGLWWGVDFKVGDIVEPAEESIYFKDGLQGKVTRVVEPIVYVQWTFKNGHTKIVDYHGVGFIRKYVAPSWAAAFAVGDTVLPGVKSTWRGADAVGTVVEIQGNTVTVAWCYRDAPDKKYNNTYVRSGYITHTDPLGDDAPTTKTLATTDVPHYSTNGIQPIDIINANKLDFLEGNIVKYLLRYKHKGSPLADLTKLVDYTNMLLKREKELHPSDVPQSK
jgi:hypothetical protein